MVAFADSHTGGHNQRTFGESDVCHFGINAILMGLSLTINPEQLTLLCERISNCLKSS
jgi:hypothetical protein